VTASSIPSPRLPPHQHTDTACRASTVACRAAPTAYHAPRQPAAAPFSAAPPQQPAVAQSSAAAGQPRTWLLHRPGLARRWPRTASPLLRQPQHGLVALFTLLIGWISPWWMTSLFLYRPLSIRPCSILSGAKLCLKSIKPWLTTAPGPLYHIHLVLTSSHVSEFIDISSMTVLLLVTRHDGLFVVFLSVRALTMMRHSTRLSSQL
jgi:hypothetical protein